jgi:hypothetical protein
MIDFDWDELDHSVSEWKNLYNFLMTNVDEKGINIKAALYTTVQVEPHVYDKCKIDSIKKTKCYLLEDYLVLHCKGEEKEYDVPVYRAFELKTDGKIRDITLILQFIKTELYMNKEKTLPVTVV